MKQQPPPQASGASETTRFFCTQISSAASAAGETVTVGSLLSFGLAIKGWYANKDSKASKENVRVREAPRRPHGGVQRCGVRRRRDHAHGRGVLRRSRSRNADEVHHGNARQGRAFRSEVRNHAGVQRRTRG